MFPNLNVKKAKTGSALASAYAPNTLSAHLTVQASNVKNWAHELRSSADARALNKRFAPRVHIWGIFSSRLTYYAYNLAEMLLKLLNTKIVTSLLDE